MAEIVIERRTASDRRGPAGAVDFDLAGIAGVRLLDASPDDEAAVERQLGPIRRPLERTPDIVVRFVDRLPPSGAVRYLGVNDAGFTDTGFLVLRGKHKARARVQIPLDRAGAGCEIVCEHGVPAVPLLVPLLNLSVLARGILPLHASAFLHEGIGIVATGWSKGGKTEALLACAAAGATYVGDEWVYIDLDGSRVFGIPEPIRVWDWHLRELSQLRSRLSRSERLRLGTLAGVGGLLRSTRRLNRVRALTETQRYVDLEPAVLFGARQATSMSFDRLVFVMTHASPEVIVSTIEPKEIARRMVFSLGYERRDLLAYYQAFRFAFPESFSPVIEASSELERDLLERAFADKPAHLVAHPYPVRFPTLLDAIERCC